MFVYVNIKYMSNTTYVYNIHTLIPTNTHTYTHTHTHTHTLIGAYTLKMIHIYYRCHYNSF